MVYREAPSPIEVARDVWIEAQELETVAAMNKYRAQAELARAQGELETAWAEHGALTALERHLGAIIQASERVPSRAPPKRLTSELENAERDAKQAKQKIAQAEARVAEARSELERVLDELGSATRARMAAEAKLKALGQVDGP